MRFVIVLLVLLVPGVVGPTPPPRWIPVPESETPDGTLCVPRLFGPTGPCFSKPAPDWRWVQTEGGGSYSCRRKDDDGGFTIHAYQDTPLTREAVAAEVRRTSFNPVGAPVRGLAVQPSDVPVSGSFRYSYALMGAKGAVAIVVGYVTPSGWIVSGLFETAGEPEDFRRFVKTYRIPETRSR